MINRRFYYLLSLIFVFVIPACVAGYFAISRIDLWALFTFIAGITVLGSVWDIWATRHGKRDPIWLWQFNFKDTLGVKIFDLPIGEYIFYIASSTYIIFMWEGINYVAETGDVLVFFLLPILGIGSTLLIFAPHFLRVRGDEL